MPTKPDDFKASALALLGHANAWRLTTRDRATLWRLAFNTRDLTARDAAELSAITTKIEPTEAVA